MEVTATKGQILKGKPVADQISENLIKEVDELVKDGINPKLAIVRVGARGDDLAYERGALKRCQTIGIETEVVELAEDITQEDYEKTLRSLNENKDVHGILCLRPFPNQLNEEVIKYVISPEKDVDCFSPINSAKIMEGDKSGFPPCTPTAVVEILKELERSPPVPTISNTSISLRSLVQCVRIPTAEAVISSIVSPFMARAVR